MFQPRPTAQPKPLMQDQARAGAFRVKVLTLFPEVFPGPLAASLTGKALSDRLWALETLDIRNFARNAALENQQGDTWNLAISPKFEALYREENCSLLQQAIRAKTGKPVTLKVNIQEPGKPTPDQLLAKRKQARLQQAVEMMQQDAFVQMLQQQFDATLDLKSVVPTDE